jgi:DNA-binding PadR family transcriptional regulator
MIRDPHEHLPLTHVVFHVLLSLSGGPLHGYGIMKDVDSRTGGALELEAGTLYGAIKRLRDDRLIEEVPSPARTDARRRYYGLTSFGAAVLHAEAMRLARMVDFARAADILPAPGGGS